MISSAPRLTWQRYWLEFLLIVSIIALSLQVLGPWLIQWWQLPQPGAVGIDYLSEDFFKGERPSFLSNGYVCSLPEQYFEGDAWPLVIFLHGSGERGTDPEILISFGRSLSKASSASESAIVILPQCRPHQSWQPQDVTGFVEYVCRNYRIDRARIYLTGFSMGAYGTWATAAANPSLFAAIVPIAGGGNKENTNALANTPTWAFHGAIDKVVSISETTEIVNAVQLSGGKPKLTVIPDAGHLIPQRVVDMPELWQWLFQQKRAHSELPSKAATGEEKEK